MTVSPDQERFAIRRFQPEDAPTVRRIVAEVLASYGLETDAVTDADLEDIERSYASGSFYVVERAGCVVGCGGLKLADGQGEIRKMYFLPEARGHGLGRRLLNDLIEEARRRGARSVHLETNSVLKEAIGLYRSMGFSERPYESLACRCDLFMELSL